jgi:cytochrome c oxidase subunit 2
MLNSLTWRRKRCPDDSGVFGQQREMRASMKHLMGWVAPLAVLAAVLVIGDTAWADQPRPWEIYFQEPASPTMHEVVNLHNILLWVMGTVCVLVLTLLVVIAVRFNSRANPEPSTFTHNTGLEVVWTLIPALILVFLAFPSFRLLYFLDTVPQDADLTIKATGSRWYWTYQYPDVFGDFEFDAVMVPTEDLGTDAFGNTQPRLLAADNDVVVPVGKVVKVQVTATDVLHSWAMPSFGIKIDAVPGRLNETWFKAEKVGMYYGQCSELCGINHAFMPIAIRVVSEEAYEKWVSDMRAKNDIAMVPAEQAVAAVE